MFVLTVEGVAYVNKGLWCTHKVLAVAATREEALKALSPDLDDEDIVILTDMDSGKRERINTE